LSQSLAQDLAQLAQAERAGLRFHPGTIAPLLREDAAVSARVLGLLSDWTKKSWLVVTTHAVTRVSKVTFGYHVGPIVLIRDIDTAEATHSGDMRHDAFGVDIRSVTGKRIVIHAGIAHTGYNIAPHLNRGGSSGERTFLEGTTGRCISAIRRANAVAHQAATPVTMTPAALSGSSPAYHPAPTNVSPSIRHNTPTSRPTTGSVPQPAPTRSGPPGGNAHGLSDAQQIFHTIAALVTSAERGALFTARDRISIPKIAAVEQHFGTDRARLGVAAQELVSVLVKQFSATFSFEDAHRLVGLPVDTQQFTQDHGLVVTAFMVVSEHLDGQDQALRSANGSGMAISFIQELVACFATVLARHRLDQSR
jgi:hypothetical protein